LRLAAADAVRDKWQLAQHALRVGVTFARESK